METETLIPIVLGEILLLCTIVIAILLLLLTKIRREKATALKKLSAKENISSDEQAIEQPRPYLELIDHQLVQTREHHNSLEGGNPEIALDLDPEAPINLRTAALRHAILIAEKECFGLAGQSNWELLASKYQQLMQFHEDFAPTIDNSEGSQNNQDQDTQALISNMETELQKQARFMQESETCIQLMEEELSALQLKYAELEKSYLDLKTQGP